MNTEIIRDMSSMVGKMKEFKALLEDTYTRMVLDDPSEPLPDDLADIYGVLDNINKTKIDVSDENISAEEDYIDRIIGSIDDILGYNEVNGFPFYGFNLGGDWESPLVGVIVSDGKDLFTYIPLKGNNFNESNLAAFGNDDDIEDEIDVVVSDILSDIAMAFQVPTPKTTSESEATDSLEEALNNIDDACEDLVEAVSALTDDSTGDFLEKRLEELLKDIKGYMEEKTNELIEAAKVIASKESFIENLTDTNNKLSDRINDLNNDVAYLNKKLSGTSTGPSDAELAYAEIAKIVASVSGGSITPSPVAVPVSPSAPAAPAKPLKKISLPSKTVKFEYVYGVEMDGSTAILHIIKKDDWAVDELAKEGRVDVDTISRLKAVVPFKRDKFVYVLSDTYSSVEEVVDAISKCTTINLEHSKDVQAKF